MAQSLAVKYRPKRFEDVCSQTSIIKILEKQIQTRSFSNCYLFAGPSGCGKTTLARIFANQINGGKGNPIEIDAASNNGVDNVRQIIQDAGERSIDSEYKVFIIDETHSLTNQAWQAFLKTIEEPPKYTLFLFCTTNPEKIPATINNRLMRFNLARIPSDVIKSRLTTICANEGFTNYVEGCDYISKIANGGMRDAIALLEKCANFNTEISLDNVLSCLGTFDYDLLLDLTGCVVKQDSQAVIEIIEDLYTQGYDMHLFVDKYLDFMLNLHKYCLFDTLTCTNIPAAYEQRCAGFKRVIPGATSLSFKYAQRLLSLKNQIKLESDAKITIEIELLSMGACDTE